MCSRTRCRILSRRLGPDAFLPLRNQQDENRHQCHSKNSGCQHARKHCEANRIARRRARTIQRHQSHYNEVIGIKTHSLMAQFVGHLTMNMALLADSAINSTKPICTQILRGKPTSDNGTASETGTGVNHDSYWPTSTRYSYSSDFNALLVTACISPLFAMRLSTVFKRAPVSWCLPSR